MSREGRTRERAFRTPATRKPTVTGWRRKGKRGYRGHRYKKKKKTSVAKEYPPRREPIFEQEKTNIALPTLISLPEPKEGEKSGLLTEGEEGGAVRLFGKNCPPGSSWLCEEEKEPVRKGRRGLDRRREVHPQKDRRGRLDYVRTKVCKRSGWLGKKTAPASNRPERKDLLDTTRSEHHLEERRTYEERRRRRGGAAEAFRGEREAGRTENLAIQPFPP